MKFSDIFKKSFLEGINNAELTAEAIVAALLITAIIALYIYCVYRVTCRRAFYSKSFNISLVALALITAAIILTIQSSVVVSLGMVGALSIVRFRTAIKDPMDLVFLFWSISVGIICGAGLFTVAVTVSLIVTAAILLLSLFPTVRVPMLLVINASDCETEEELLKTIKKYTKIYTVKSRNITRNGMDMIVELRVREGGKLVREISKMEAVNAVSLCSHDGEVTF